MSTISNTTSRPWWKDVVCYEIWPKSFKDSDGDGNGDIQGVISKLDYLKDLGVDLIWICPTYQSPMKDFGYDISDYQEVNPMFGTLADMEQLINEVHERGMRILLDLVITHTSEEHSWFLESRSSKDNPKHDWYIWQDPRPRHTVLNAVTGTADEVEEPTNWKACFGGSAWCYAREREQYYLHLFLAEEPDLNWENSEVREAVFEAAIGFWLDKGIDGFRIDTVNRISKDWKFPDAPTKLEGRLQPGSDFYINGPQSHFYLKEMRKYIDNHTRVKESGHDLMLLGELPRTPYDDVLRYTHPDSKELSMVFDFDMVKLGGHDNPDEVQPSGVKNLCDGDPSFTLPQFKLELKKVQDLIASGAWGTVFMENHDQCRSINRYATPNPDYHLQAAKLLCLLQTTLSGTQFLYQGQEIGMLDMPLHWGYEHFRDPAARANMEGEFRKGIDAYEKARIGNLKFGRDNSRTPVQWTSGPNAGFSTCEEGATWMGVNDNKDKINLEDQQKDPNSVWHFWKHQINVRKTHREIFMHGAFELLDPENEKTFTYLKTASDGEVALVCLNFSDNNEPLFIPAPLLKRHVLEFLSGNVGEPGNMYLPLQAWEGRVYMLKAYPRASDGACLTRLSANAPWSAVLDSAKEPREAGITEQPLSAILEATKVLRADGVDPPLSALLTATKYLRENRDADPPLSALLDASLSLRQHRFADGHSSVLLDTTKNIKESGATNTLSSAALESNGSLKDEPASDGA